MEKRIYEVPVIKLVMISKMDIITASVVPTNFDRGDNLIEWGLDVFKGGN